MHPQTVSDAFADYRARVEQIIADDAWERFGDLFTEDATYRRHGAPELMGRSAIRDWIAGHMRSFPGNRIAEFTVEWRSYDEDRRHVVYELRHTMADPGDGSLHQASTTTLLTYAGDGLWSRAEDMHNPQAYLTMYRSWARLARAHGLISREEELALERL